MKEKREDKNAGLMKVRFPISAKLITIITIIVLVSLGAITVLVSWLVREDLRVAAEENNFEANRRSALEAESTLENIRSESLMLLQTLSVDGTSNVDGTSSDAGAETARYYFEHNPHAAFVVFSEDGAAEECLVNERFFLSREIEPALADSYREKTRRDFRRAALGETVLLNAAPHFARPVLALFFPWKNGGAGAVVFSSEKLSDAFGFGVNQSWLINGESDILVHSDFELVRSGENVAESGFIRSLRESREKSMQILLETGFGFEQEDADAPLRAGGLDGWVMARWESIRRGAGTAARAVSRGLSRLTGHGEEAGAPLVAADGGGDTGARQFVAFTKLDIGASIVITSVEYDKVFEGIAATTRRNAYLTVAVLCISIMFIWFFSKSISVPLKDLAAAAREVEGGGFDVAIKPRGRDEIGVLGDSFRRMCSALGIFGRFTNRDIALRAMRGEIKPGGEPKHATVLFTDIRNFTAKSEEFTRVFGNDASNLIVKWLNNYLTRMVECVEKTGGVVDKFIGDAVMAHWGTAYTAGSPQKDAYNCVKTALMMRAALVKMNRERKPGDPGNPSIRIGCGINTGSVTAGQIGSELRMEYTVIGDPVNLASRTESMNKTLGTDILITEDTWCLVKDHVIAEEMPSVKVKGKEKPVRLFAVINLAGMAKGPRTLADVRKLLGIKLRNGENTSIAGRKK